MEKETKNARKLGTIPKIRNTGTSEIAGNRLSTLPLLLNVSKATSRSRATMMPGDIAQLQKMPKRKIAAGNRSILSSQLSLDVQKKIDIEIELGLLYDEYLQSVMMDLMTKKKVEEKKRLMAVQLVTMAQEIDQDMEKLIKVKTRERDIINLSLSQEEADAQLIAATKCTEDETLKIVKDTLIKLQPLLEPLDVLQCNGIILPETQDEWEKTREILNKCSNALKNITNLIGSKGEMYCAVNIGLNNFVDTYEEIKNVQKKLEEALCNLQVLVLKNASFSSA